MTASASNEFGTELSPGIRVGGAQFILKRLIGRGENATVWLARDVKAMREVALKFLPRAFRAEENLLERLKREVQRSQQLRHPHVVATYGLVLDHESVAVAMEFVDGWSLATLKVDKLCRCYDVEEIRPWILDAAEALEYAHNEFGIVHGDLKPANLLVSAREGIKVSDFGLAALIRAESARRGLARGVSGGIGFLSPQQVMGGAPSERDDVYSLGATIFDLLTGTPPFYQGEIIAQICGLKPPSLAERLAELDIQSDPVPPVWEDTVALCLAKEPAERPPGISAVRRLLGRAEVSGAATPPAPTEKGEPKEEPPPTALAETPPARPDTPAVESPPAGEISPRPKPAMWAGFLMLLLVGGLFAALWWEHERKKPAGPSPVTPSGMLDKSFKIGSGADDCIRCLAVQTNGKIVLGGLFSTFNGVPNHRIVRLNPDGSLDAPFAMQPPGRVHAVAVQNDGKILMAGETMVEKRPQVRVVRLHGDGQREADWGLSVRCNAEVRTLALQPDGKILVGGSFTSASGRPCRRLLRLSSNGRLDDAFDTGEGASAAVWSIAVQPDGKILVAGAFDQFKGRPAGHMVRLNPDGSCDPSFQIGAGADGNILAVVLGANGNILLGGKFTSINGVACPHIARLNPNGGVDPGFKPGNGPKGVVQSVAIQPDGKILLGGGFDAVNGVPRHGVARLLPDGSLDQNFNPGEGASGFVWKVAVQPDGKALVAGAFDSFGGTPCGKLARLSN